MLLYLEPRISSGAIIVLALRATGHLSIINSDKSLSTPQIHADNFLKLSALCTGANTSIKGMAAFIPAASGR